MEEETFYQPGFHQWEQIWLDKPYYWQKKNYLVHLWNQAWNKHRPEHLRDLEPSFENIRTWNGTLGQIARYVLYGSPDIIPHNAKANMYNPVS